MYVVKRAARLTLFLPAKKVTLKTTHGQKKIQEKTGNKNATSHIIQAISMTVQRGNAVSIMGTLGPLRKLEDFFDIIPPREERS